MATLMTTWTQVTGYPIVSIEQVGEDKDQKSFRLTQYVFIIRFIIMDIRLKIIQESLFEDGYLTRPTSVANSTHHSCPEWQ